MAESKEQATQEEPKLTMPAHTDDDDSDEEKPGSSPRQADPGKTSKSKKKKKRSKLKSLLSRKPNEDIQLSEVEEALKSVTMEERKTLTKDEAKKLEFMIKKMNELMPGGRKQMGDHKFWKTQPVIRFDETVEKEGQIEAPRPDLIEKEKTELKAPKDLEFVEIDMTSQTEVQEVYELLSGHYVEDDEAAFRFKYSASFLKWALVTPDYKSSWHVGLRATHTERRRLCAFISGIPVTLRVRDKTIKTVEINFLCIHKKLRGKYLAPILIKEITRRCHELGVWEAVYTGGVVLPKPVATCRYFHRPLDWIKLYETGFSPLPPGSTKERMVLRNRVPDVAKVRGVRLMEEKDVPAVTGLLRLYLQKFDLAPQYSEEEVRHWFLHKGEDQTDRVIWTYVVQDPGSEKITDCFSFYSLPSTVLAKSKHDFVRAAYLFYYATNTPHNPRPAYQKRISALIQDALILAHNLKFDVFNALTLLDNSVFLEDLKFGAGDGWLNYYLFNYRALPMAGGTDIKGQPDKEGSGVGLVML